MQQFEVILLHLLAEASKKEHPKLIFHSAFQHLEVLEYVYVYVYNDNDQQILAVLLRHLVDNQHHDRLCSNRYF